MLVKEDTGCNNGDRFRRVHEEPETIGQNQQQTTAIKPQTVSTIPKLHMSKLRPIENGGHFSNDIIKVIISS